MKRIILHIGHDKTATTSIQDTFKNNNEMLLESGYFYPVHPDGLSHHNRLFALLFKDDWEDKKELFLIQGRERLDLAWRYKEWLTQALLETQADNIIFSGEYFPYFSAVQVKKIRDFFDHVFLDVEYEVFMYTRNPVSYAASAYQQSARFFPDNNKVRNFLYKDNVSKFIKVFGEQNVHLYKFEEACRHECGPVYYLNKKMGLPESVLGRMQLNRENESISALAVDILLYINNRIPYTQLNREKCLRNRGDAEAFFSLPGNKYQIDRNVRGKVIENARIHIEWLRDSFEIEYSYGEKDMADEHTIVFSDAYAKNIILVLKTVSPVMRKLAYEYFQEKSRETRVDGESEAYIRMLLLHIKKSYPLTIRLPLYCLSETQRARNFLKKSTMLRKLRRRLIGSGTPREVTKNH